MTSKRLPASLALFALALLAAGGYSLHAAASDSDDKGRSACGVFTSANADGQKVSPCGALAPVADGEDTELIAARADKADCDEKGKTCCADKAECEKKAGHNSKAECSKCDAATSGQTVAISADDDQKKAEKEKDKEKERTITSPKLIAVMFHSDYCGSCKAMEPRIKDAAEKLTDKPVLFVTLDLTDDKTKKQAELLAGALGLDKVWSENHTRTGFMKLVNADSKEAVETITVRHQAGDIVDKAAAAIEAQQAKDEAEASADDQRTAG